MKWFVIVRRSAGAEELLRLAGPFSDSASARATVEWCKLRALIIDKKAGEYFYTVETATGGRGIFTPTGNLFTPWFKGLLP